MFALDNSSNINLKSSLDRFIVAIRPVTDATAA